MVYIVGHFLLQTWPFFGCNKKVLQAIYTPQIKAVDGFKVRSAFDRSTVLVTLCCYARETSECIKQRFKRIYFDSMAL